MSRWCLLLLYHSASIRSILFLGDLSRFSELHNYTCHIVCTCSIWLRDISFSYPMVHHLLNYKWGLSLRLHFFSRITHVWFLFVDFHWTISKGVAFTKSCWFHTSLRWRTCSLLRSSFTSLSHKSYSLFVSKAIPYSIACIYYKIEFSWFYLNLLYVRKWGYLMLLCFFNISVWTFLNGLFDGIFNSFSFL